MGGAKVDYSFFVMTVWACEIIISPANCTTPERVNRDNGRQSGKDLTTSPVSSDATTRSEGTTCRTISPTACRENANF